MNEICAALEPELGEWARACAALQALLAGDEAFSREAAAASFSLVARSTSELGAKYSWVTRERSKTTPPKASARTALTSARPATGARLKR